MQILLVMGVTWIGIAAKQGGVHVVYWIAAILTLFLPSAAVVTYCVKIWPEEGGVFQWSTRAFGPLAGFLNAWNFGFWALITVSTIGNICATSLAYALGDHYAWIEESKPLIHTFNIVIFAVIFLLCVVGFRILKWFAHFGTFIMILINVLLVGLLFIHPAATPAHPHHNPQAAFSFALTLPMLTFLSLNLFAKMALGGLTGIEQIAVFAGETKDPARSVWRSAWIAAPFIGLLFILGTGALLTYTPADKIDLTGPIPQVLAAAFGTSNAASSGINWPGLLGRGAILGLALFTIAQFAMIVAETSRLPMVAGWDGILPEWFTRLSPRYGTPVRSIAVIVAFAVVACVLATQFSSGAQEAYQLLTVEASFLYDFYFGMMFLIPLTVGNRFGPAPSLGLKLAAATGLFVTSLHAVISSYPIIDIPHPLLFAAKIAGIGILLNLAGYALYRQAQRSIAASS
jgi:amino acid transporter